MAGTLIQIVDWDHHFENNRTREMKKMAWVPIPNKMDGDGYTELLQDHPNGGQHYAAWIAMVLVASRCATRGTLLRTTNSPHTPATLSRITKIPAEWYDEALPRLEDIGWIERKPMEGNGLHVPAEIPHETATLAHPTDYGTERNGTELNKPPLPPLEQKSRSNGTEGWGGIVEKLRSVGVMAARATAEALEANACPPELAIRVIDHWKANSPAWGQGALVTRLENLGPGQNPSEGWPEISKAAESDKRRAEDRVKLAKQLENRQAADAERAANAKRRSALEAQYGPVLDGLTEDRQRELIRTHAKPESPMLFPKIRDKPAGIVREILLDILERMASGELEPPGPDG